MGDVVRLPKPLRIAPRGLRRTEAAAYVGISPSLFDELVREGKMPKAKKFHEASVWDVRALDEAFDAMPEKGLESPFSDVSL